MHIQVYLTNGIVVTNLKRIDLYLYNRYFITVWFNSFIVSFYLYTGNHDRKHKPIDIEYPSTAGMGLH